MWAAWGWGPASAIFGALVGLSEIISRYRDEPLRATANRYGIGYLVLDAVISAAAYGFLLRYPTQILPIVASDPLMAALVAGFGAMAVLRSKFLIFRAEDGKEYPIEPSIVMETFLRMLDRKIDRLRARKPQERVFEQMKDIADFDPVANYLEASLLSFQNLGDEDKEAITEVIREYRNQTAWPGPLKVMAAGFAFLTIAGKENFDQVMANLKRYLATIQAQPAGQPAAPGPAPQPGPAGAGP